MPELNGWVEETLSEIAEVQSVLDHGIILWVNLPSVGILSAHRLDWVLTYLSNTLNKYKKNGMAIVIHANRAGQVGGTEWGKTAVGSKNWFHLFGKALLI